MGRSIGGCLLFVITLGCVASDGVGAQQERDVRTGEPIAKPVGGTMSSTADLHGQVEFEAAIEVADGKLRIRYRVRHRGDRPLLVLNQLPSRIGASDLTPDPYAVYIDAVGDGTVEISKRAFAPPFGVALEIPDQFCTTPLAPGESVGEDLEVPLPLVRQRPYESFEPGALPEPVGAVRFCVGVVAAADVHVPYERQGLPVLYHDDTTVAAQTLLCSNTVTLQSSVEVPAAEP